MTVVLITSGTAIAFIVFVVVIRRRQEARTAAFLAERDGR